MLTLLRFSFFCVSCVNDFLGKNCQLIAGAIAFWALFSIFPLLLSITLILSYIIDPSSGETAKTITIQLAEILPEWSRKAVGGYISQQIQFALERRTTSGIASVLLLLFASTIAFGVIRKGINAAWGISKARAYLVERIIDFALVIITSVLVITVLVIGPILQITKEVFTNITRETLIFEQFAVLTSNILFQITSFLVFPVIIFITLSGIYKILPNTPVKFQHVLPGALLTSICLYFLNDVFVLYVLNVLDKSDFNVLYGPFSAVIALLLWAYWSAIFVLAGALITSRFSSYMSKISAFKDPVSIKFILTGFSRVSFRLTTVGR